MANPSKTFAVSAGLSVPGTVDYPNGELTEIRRETVPNESDVRCVMLDEANGFAYYATGSEIVKVAVSEGNDPPQRISASGFIPRASGEFATSVIDPVHGYGYLGTSGSPAQIVKVGLGDGNNPPSLIGAITLAPGESNIGSATIDVANGYAYFGTTSSPTAVVKVALGEGDALPTRIGSAAGIAGENGFISAVIDAASGYAYFGVDTPPTASVVKFSLGAGDVPPSRVGAAILEVNEFALRGAVIDTVHQYAYFGTEGQHNLIKIALGEGDDPPRRVGALVLNVDENSLNCGAIDPVHGYAYFACNVGLLQISLGDGDALPTGVGLSTAIVSADLQNRVAAFDASRGYIHFAAFSGCSKVYVGDGSAPPVEVGRAEFIWGEGNFNTALVDQDHGYGYLSGNGMITKFRLGPGADQPQRVGSLMLPSGDANIQCAAIDTVHGYAYYATNTGSPEQIIKVALGDGDALPTRIGSITLDAGEIRIFSALLDPSSGYGYFATTAAFGFTGASIIKIQLGEGDIAPTRIGSLTLNTNENTIKCGMIDTVHGYAYYGASRIPSMIIKVALGAGSDLPTRVGALTLPAQEYTQDCSLIDTTNNYGYYACSTNSNPRIVKVELGAGDALPIRVGGLNLTGTDGQIVCGVLNAQRGDAVFGTNPYSIPRRFIKVALGEGVNPPTRTGFLTSMTGATCLALDETNQYAYGGSGRSIIKLSLDEHNFLKGTAFTLPHFAKVHDVRFYSHSAAGNMRLSLYSNDDPRTLLWQSGVINNETAAGEIVVPISTGGPAELTLVPGSYWACWQTDTPESIGSYSAGTAGQGFYMPYTFGTSTATIASSQVTATSERWTEYITYDFIGEVGWMLF